MNIKMNFRLNSFIQKTKLFFAEPSCRIGFIQCNEKDHFSINDLNYYNKIIWVENPSDGWYADPFILDADESTITVLVEHFSYSTQKGVIDKVVVDRSSFRVKSAHTILDTDSHLSFPNILRIHDKIYVYPENCHSSTLSIYRYDKNLNYLVDPVVLIKEPLIDSCIERINGEYYIFATIMREKTELSDKVIRIYNSRDPFGPYSLVQTLEIDKPYGRSAGSFLREDGVLIRPTQNCDGGYGLEVIFNKALVKDNYFEFSELKRIGPRHFSRWTGIHTFNVYSNVIVVDGLSYRRGFLISLLLKVYNNIKSKIG